MSGVNILFKYINLTLVCVGSMLWMPLAAVDVKKEFFTQKDVPELYKSEPLADYYTAITLTGCPAGVVDVFVCREADKDDKKIHTQCGSQLDEITEVVSSIGYFPGERSIHTFKSSNGKVLAEVKVIPNPLFAKSSVDGAKIEAIITSIVDRSYFVELSGFHAGEKVVIESASYDEKMNHPLTLDDGKKAIGFSPAVIGKLGGVARFKIVRKSGEILSLEMPWGLEWLKYHLRYDENKKIISGDKDEQFLKDPEVAKYFKSKR